MLTKQNLNQYPKLLIPKRLMKLFPKNQLMQNFMNPMKLMLEQALSQQTKTEE